MIYGKLPIYVGQFEFDLPEVMYYLYLPILMDDDPRGLTGAYDVRLPRNVEVCENLIKQAYTHSIQTRGYPYKYMYLSARKGWATPGNPLNRPGWHCDGFGTNDLNYVWWVGPGTRFAIQSFYGIVSDHNRSMRQFDEQIQEESIVEFEERGLFQIDPSVVHSTPLIPEPGCWRQYIKVSLSDERYNLENNSHNWLFDYNWPMHKREAVRNDPHKAQRDYS